MKKIIFILAIIGLVSCNTEKKIEENSIEKVKTEIISENTAKSDFSNPAIIYGSDFLSFFKALRKLGKYDEMIKFTDSTSINEYGIEFLEKEYENAFVNMSNSSLKNIEKLEDGTFKMFYLNSEFSTKKAFDITVKIENDSTKLVYQNKYPF